MKQQVLMQKVSVYIFIAFLFVSYSTHAVAHGRLEFTEGESTIREIAENTPAGTNIGEPLRYSSGEIFDCVHFSLHGPDAQAFDFVPVYRGAQLRTKSTLDYETKDAYEVRVIAVGSSVLTRDAITVTISVTDVPEFVEIPDRSLATMIRVTLGLAAGDGITEAKMLELTRLDAGPKSRLIGIGEIENLTGLERAENLTTLLLGSNSVRNLTPLAGLTKLTRLEIYANKVIYLNSLADLTNLKSLNLSYNQISDITPLKNLTNLTVLFLQVNVIRDITPLKGLTNLTELSLLGNQITDLTPLANLTADIDIDVSSASAPSANGDQIDSILDLALLKTLGRDMLQARLQELRAESNGSLKYQQVIALLESVLAVKRPGKTVLLANYPNPFNPETWIPYHLAKAANVEIAIYDTYGTVVRHLQLGHKTSGYYTIRNQAAYWDGLNDFGERVANGIYFFQLQADIISPLRKMVILK